MVPVDSDRITRVPPYSGYLKELISFRLQDYHLLRSCFPTSSTIIQIFYSTCKVLQPQFENWFGLFPFRSPLLRKSIFLSLPPVTKMFQFAGLNLRTYEFSTQYLRITTSGFPHSEISGSKFTYNSPKHIVVCHVLHQLLVPRHPPGALSNLITIFVIFPNLMRYFNVLYTFIRLPHYQVFKELFT